MGFGVSISVLAWVLTRAAGEGLAWAWRKLGPRWQFVAVVCGCFLIGRGTGDLGFVHERSLWPWAIGIILSVAYGWVSFRRDDREREAARQAWPATARDVRPVIDGWEPVAARQAAGLKRLGNVEDQAQAAAARLAELEARLAEQEELTTAAYDLLAEFGVGAPAARQARRRRKAPWLEGVITGSGGTAG